MKIARWRDRATMPWRNGGGVTHELWREPDDGAFVVRVSVAEVDADGPFSAFPGVDRVIVLLSGAGFTLTRDDGLVADCARPGVPFAFHGEDRWSCTLHDGPVRDFNVMVDRARARASVVRRDGGALVGPGFVLALAPTGDLDALDLVALDDGEVLDVAAPALHVAITRL